MQEKRPEVEVLQKKHPLLEIKYFPSMVWPSFLEKWSDPSLELEMRIGLLHCGFDIPIDTDEGRAERLVFYFDVADGYGDESNFSEDASDTYGTRLRVGGTNKHFSAAEIRQLVAKKAFQQLCLRFFKDEGKRGAPSWARFLLTEESFNKILWFFRPAPHGGLVNNPYTTLDKVQEHYKEIVRSFLDSFIFLVWGGFDTNICWAEVLDVKHYELTFGPKARFIDARPQIVEILYATRNMRRLIELTSLRPGNNNVSKEVGEEVFDKLTELAKIKTGPMDSLTVAQSLLQGNEAAEVLTVLKARKYTQEQVKLGLA